MAKFALVDSKGVVVNIIDAEQEFINDLPRQIEDPEVDSGNLVFSEAHDIGDQEVGIGWRYQRGEWVAPEVDESR